MLVEAEANSNILIIMDIAEEEKFREAACIGDINKVNEMLAHGANVNAQNKMNGWSPLHWAAKRGHHSIIKALVEHGANLNLKNNKGEIAADVAQDELSLKLLNAEHKKLDRNPQLLSNFIPNYIKNPIFPYSAEPAKSASSKQSTVLLENSFPQVGFKHKLETQKLTAPTEFSPLGLLIVPDTIVFNVRLCGTHNQNFYEISFPRHEDVTYDSFAQKCLQHILGAGNAGKQNVKYIIKLPNIILKNDEDIKRLTDYQCLELHLS